MGASNPAKWKWRVNNTAITTASVAAIATVEAKKPTTCQQQTVNDQINISRASYQKLEGGEEGEKTIYNSNRTATAEATTTTSWATTTSLPSPPSPWSPSLPPQRWSQRRSQRWQQLEEQFLKQGPWWKQRHYYCYCYCYYYCYYYYIITIILNYCYYYYHCCSWRFVCKLQRGDGPGSHVQLIALPRYLTAGLNYQVTLAGRNFAGWQLDTNLYIYI